MLSLQKKPACVWEPIITKKYHLNPQYPGQNLYVVRYAYLVSCLLMTLSVLGAGLLQVRFPYSVHDANRTCRKNLYLLLERTEERRVREHCGTEVEAKL